MKTKKGRLGIDLILGTIGLSTMTLCVLAGIVFRALESPLLWTEEVAKWMMVWITFAGASYSFKHGGLLRVDYFVKTFMGKRLRLAVNVFAMILMFAFFIFMSYSSVRYLMNTWVRHQVFSVTRVPFAAVIISLFIGGILSAIFSLKEAFILIKRRHEPEEAHSLPADNQTETAEQGTITKAAKTEKCPGAASPCCATTADAGVPETSGAAECSNAAAASDATEKSGPNADHKEGK